MQILSTTDTDLKITLNYSAVIGQCWHETQVV